MILHTRRSSNRNDGEKVLSCVLLHVIRLSRVAQLIVSRRVAGIRVGLLALLAYHFDVVASIPRYLVIKILPVLILKPAIPSKLQQHVFQSPPPRVEQWLRLTRRKKITRILRLFSRCFLHLLFDMMRETENIVEYLQGEESVEVRKWN